jgi:protein SCO1
MKAFFRLMPILFCMNALACNADKSMYQLELELTDQDGASIRLDTFRGKPVLIGMFYADCPYVCPLTIHTLQKTEAGLDPAARAQLRVLLISLDPQRDTPAKLAEVSRRHKLDTTRWKLARTDEAGVRKLAAVLGLRFKQLPDGEFNHSTVINLLDHEGVQITSSGNLGAVDQALLERIRALHRQ